jgi:putative glutamine amidotransferase
VTGTLEGVRPLIGVTTSEMRGRDRVLPDDHADPPQRELALAMAYLRAVALAGGVPVVLPPVDAGLAGDLVARLDGVCLSGGPDLDPVAYGAPPHPQLGPTESALDAFELAVVREARAAEVPVLGICRGMQLLDVSRGGTLHQHVPDLVDGRVGHRQVEAGTRATHPVEVAEGSRLAGVLGRGGELWVNSFHHQAVDRLGDGLTPVAWSPDGLVEALEGDPDGPFLLAVQWHAETLVDRAEELALFRALVDAAAARSRPREAV